MPDAVTDWPVVSSAIVVSAMAISAGLVSVLLPVLRRHMLANPNERSSHSTPTPQGGGIAVVTATIVCASVAACFVEPALGLGFTIVLAAAAFIACVGMIDDIRAIPVAPRLFLQAVAVAVVIASLPSDLRVFPELPWLAERMLLFIGGLWFVNLVNFMDGIDWMTVVEVVPVAAALSVFGFLGALPPEGLLVALALLGATLGFAPFNRPVARLFLGDVGSLPIGLLVGWLLVLLAGGGHLAAAVLLPAYYLADATTTLLRLAKARVPVWRAHRSHYYQRALDRGFSVRQIVGLVFALNLALAALAIATVLASSTAVDIAAVLVGGVLVAALLFRFSRGR